MIEPRSNERGFSLRPLLLFLVSGKPWNHYKTSQNINPQQSYAVDVVNM